MKSDVSVFSRLYVGCQFRDGNLDEFFKHENQACPPSLSKHGKLRPGTKSDLVACMESTDTVDEADVNDSHPDMDCKIIDGAAAVNMLPPKGAKTFQNYAHDVFIPYLRQQLQYVSWLDVVWDVYLANSK